MHGYRGACVGTSHICVAGVGRGLRGHLRVPAVALTQKHCPPHAMHPAGRTPTPMGGACPCLSLAGAGATPAPWHWVPLSLPQSRARKGVPGGPGGGEKMPACPWRGCNSINEAWPLFSTANKANGPAQAWCCLRGGLGCGGHLLIKCGWGTVEPAVMSPRWCLVAGGGPYPGTPCPPALCPLWGDRTAGGSHEVYGTPPKPPAPLPGAAAR